MAQPTPPPPLLLREPALAQEYPREEAEAEEKYLEEYQEEYQGEKEEDLVVDQAAPCVG
jgi:hypothetical protein